jgi:hypothetical protein
MKKLLLFLLVLTGIGLTAKAQLIEDSAYGSEHKFAFSIGPELAIPAHSVYNIGYGASAKAEVPIAGRFGLTVTGGYSMLHYKSGIIGSFGTQPTGNFIPLKIGTRYSLGPGAFFEGEVGDVIETQTNFGSTRRNLFAFSLGPVFLIRLSNKQNIDLGFRYESWSQQTLQQTAIRVAYRIGG